MNVLKITAEMVKDGAYVGDVDVSEYDGSIEIDAGLGTVRFAGRISAKYNIIAKAGSGIKAGEGIKAGWGIEAGFSISAKWVSVRLRIFAGFVMWKRPTEQETQIRAEVRSGEVAFGKVVPIQAAGVEFKT